MLVQEVAEVGRRLVGGRDGQKHPTSLPWRPDLFPGVSVWMAAGGTVCLTATYERPIDRRANVKGPDLVGDPGPSALTRW